MTSSYTGVRDARVVLVTCRRWPNLSPSDRCYATALQDLGARVAVAAWNVREDQAAFRAADLVVLRASWDYHDEVASYRDWLSQLEAAGIHLLNDAAMVSRFLNKAAFMELAGNGVSTPACHVCPADAEAIGAVLSDEAWGCAVLKPVSGASGRGVQLVTPWTVGQALDAVVADVGARDLMVQEFIPEIADGEVQYVFFDGALSHAVRKLPQVGEFRTNSAFMPEVELLDRLPAGADRIEAMVRRMPARPLYARIDVVMRGPEPTLLEFEVNEPGLWLDIAPRSAAETFAHATLVRLRR